MKIAFAGTPEFAATILARLIESAYRPSAVYTQPDRKKGRGKQLAASPVKALALAHGIPVLQPTSLKGGDAAQELAALEPDVLIVVAYGLILPESILSIPTYGCINVHASLLPRWRGAAPIERAYIAGDEVTGVSIMQMDAGLDTGPVYTRSEIPISRDTTIAQLEDALAACGADSLLSVLAELQDLTPEPQTDTGATYAHKLTQQDRAVDWALPAEQIARQIRALAERAPVRCELAGRRLQLLNAESQETITKETKTNEGTAKEPTTPGTIVSAHADGIEVRCATDTLLITQVKFEGKGAVAASDAVNGYGISAGMLFDDTNETSN